MPELMLQLQHGKNMDYVKKGSWSPEEDQKLIDYIKKYRIWNWSHMPKFAGLSRSGKSCRLRWVNYLRPDLKRGPFSLEETQTVIRMHQTLGNRWSAIAKELPGRTDNEIKNFYNTHLKKNLRTKVEVKPKARVEKAKQIKMCQKKPLSTTRPIQCPSGSTPDHDQSLDFSKSSSSSYIKFDENYGILDTSDQDNDVTSVVNDENIVILESNPESTSSPDLYKKDIMDVSVDSSNVDFWLQLYMAADNLNTIYFNLEGLI